MKISARDQELQPHQVASGIREIAKDIQAYSRVQWEKHIDGVIAHRQHSLRKSSLLRRPDSLQEQFEPNHVAGRELFDQRIHDEVNNFIHTPHVQEIEPTTPTEVLSYVQRLKPRKSPDLIRFLIV
ncbi:hypothetical protein TNCV_2080041 [Trichonephila clavipes]|nr:hypothetical protein TNCV_2080041 [Trichonephila clavipes]